MEGTGKGKIMGEYRDEGWVGRMEWEGKGKRKGWRNGGGEGKRVGVGRGREEMVKGKDEL